MEQPNTQNELTNVSIPTLTGAELNGKLTTAGYAPLYGYDQIEAVHALDTAESVEDFKDLLDHTGIDTQTTECIIDAI